LPERYFQHTFANGLTFLAEQMPGMQSAAMTLLLPAGSATDPEHHSGSAGLIADVVLRGAGHRSSRELTDHLDSLGLQRGGGASVHHTRFFAAAVGSRVLDGLPAYADIIRRPHLPEDGFAAARDLALQALAGIDDEPRQKLLIKLREQFLPWPYGRNTMGVAKDLAELTLADVKADYAARYHAKGAIFSVAGNVDPRAWKDAIEQHFGDFPAGAPATIVTRPPTGKYLHEELQSEQTHIGVAYGSVPETHADYYLARMAVEVLSGGMSGRLFTEVREKRGLCYNVSAGYSSLHDTGHIICYAGTSNDRAQATLDCLLAELHRLTHGVTQAELDRAKIGLKSGTIMQGESTSARSGALAHDWWMRGRLRTLDEIKSAIDAVTIEKVNDYLKQHPPGPFTTVIVGPKALTMPE
jgi:predicted Zn-dependent peptidase